MISSPNLGQNASLLHLPIESPQETLEALLFRKLYFSHMIASFHVTKDTTYFVYFSQLTVMCQGNRNNDYSLLRVANDLYLVSSVGISSIGRKEGIA